MCGHDPIRLVETRSFEQIAQMAQDILAAKMGLWNLTVTPILEGLFGAFGDYKAPNGKGKARSRRGERTLRRDHYKTGQQFDNALQGRLRQLGGQKGARLDIRV